MTRDVVGETRDSTGISVGQLVDLLAGVFRHAHLEDPVLEAREIVAALYDAPRFWPVANPQAIVDRETYDRAQRAMRLRVQGAPLAYAVGRAAFRHLTLDVDERVLIPRPETEQLVDLVLQATASRPGGVAIDVGVGSGAIALALASEGTFSRVYGTDVSEGALAVARHNADVCKAALKAPVEFLHGSLLGPLLDVRARVVVSNPPYIALGEAASLPAGVRDWEPAVALYSGTDGMSATARLVREAAEVLEPGGVLALEVDARRASLAAELVSRDARYTSVRVELDYFGRERFIIASR